MADRTCSVEGCDRAVRCRGWCAAHHRRWYLTGDVSADRPIRPIRRRAPEERFWDLVDRTGGEGNCWPWLTAKDRHAKFWGGDQHIWAHRFAYETRHGPIPGGLCVCHECDNPPCCNPDHLFLGTQADNLADMTAKGRGAGGGSPGEQNPLAKLTDDEVRAIRALYAAGENSQRALAQQFGVDQALVWRVINRKSWAHVTP